MRIACPVEKDREPTTPQTERRLLATLRAEIGHATVPSYDLYDVHLDYSEHVDN